MGGTFFDEGSHAFTLVGGGETHREETALSSEACRQTAIGVLIECTTGETHSHWALLGDGLGDTVIVISQEKQRPIEKYSQDIVDRQTAKIKSTLSVLDSAAIDFNDPPLVGEIAVACSIGYMEFRDIVPEWSETYVNLATWYANILKRESFRMTAPE